MNKAAPAAPPDDVQGQINSLIARVAALEDWKVRFVAYLLTHPGGNALLGDPEAVPHSGEKP